MLDSSKRDTLIDWFNELTNPNPKLETLTPLKDGIEFLKLVQEIGPVNKEIDEINPLRILPEKRFDLVNKFLEEYYGTEQSVNPTNLLNQDLETELGTILFALLAAGTQGENHEKFVLAAQSLDEASQLIIFEILSPLVSNMSNSIIDMKYLLVKHSKIPEKASVPPLGIYSTPESVASPFGRLSLGRSPKTPLGELVDSPQFIQKESTSRPDISWQSYSGIKTTLSRRKMRKVERLACRSLKSRLFIENGGQNVSNFTLLRQKEEEIKKLKAKLNAEADLRTEVEIAYEEQSEKMKEKALRIRQLEDDIKRLRVESDEDSTAMKTETEKLTEEIERLHTVLDHTTTDKNLIKQELDQIETRMSSTTVDLHKYHLLEKSLNESRSNLNQTQRKLDKLVDELMTSNEKFKNVCELNETLAQNLQEQQDLVNTLKAQLAEERNKDQSFTTGESMACFLDKRIFDLEKELEESQEEIVELTKKIKVLTCDLECENEHVQQLKLEKQELEDTAKVKSTELNSHQLKIAELQNALKEMEADKVDVLKDSESQINELQSNIKKLRDELDIKQQELDNVSEEKLQQENILRTSRQEHAEIIAQKTIAMEGLEQKLFHLENVLEERQVETVELTKKIVVLSSDLKSQKEVEMMNSESLQQLRSEKLVMENTVKEKSTELNSYQLKVTELQNTLKEMEAAKDDVLKNSESQINEVQSDIKKLRDELDIKRQELDNVSEEKLQQETVLLTCRQEHSEIIARKNRDIEEFRQKLFHLDKDLEESRTRSDELIKKIEVLTHDLQCQKEQEVIYSQSLQQLRTENQDLEDTANGKCTELNSCQLKVTELQNTLKEMEADKVDVLKNSESQINEMQSDIKKLRDELDIKRQELDNVSEEKLQQETVLLTCRQEHSEIIARKNSDIEEFKQKLFHLDKDLEESRTRSDELIKKIEVLTHDLQCQKEQEVIYSQSLQQLRTENQDLEDTANRKCTELNSCQLKVTELQNTLKEMEADKFDVVKDSESQMNEMQSNIKKLRDELDKKQQELDNVLEEKLQQENILLTTRQEYNEIIARKTADMEELEQKIIHQAKDLEENRSHSEELRKKIEVLTHDLQCQKELELINSQSLQQLRSEKQELEDTANGKCTELNSYQLKITELQNTLREMEADKVGVLKNSESQIHELQSSIKKLKDELDMKQQELDNVTEEKLQQENILLTTRQEYNEIIARKTTDMEELEQKIIHQAKDQDENRSHSEELRKKIEVLTHDLQCQKQQEVIYSQSLQQLRSEKQELEDTANGKCTELNSYQLKMTELQNTLKEMEADKVDMLKNSESQINKLQSNIKKLRDELDIKQQELDNMSEEKSKQENILLTTRQEYNEIIARKTTDIEELGQKIIHQTKDLEENTSLSDVLRKKIEVLTHDLQCQRELELINLESLQQLRSEKQELEDTANVKCTELNSYQLKITELQNTLKEMEADKVDVLKNNESQINELQSDIKKLRDELDIKQQELKNVSEEKLQQENILLTTKQEYNEMIARKTSDIEELGQKIIHQAKDLEVNRSHSEELKKKIEVLTHDLQCQRELELINSQSLQQLRSEKQELEDTANGKCTELNSYQLKITELQNTLKEIETDKVDMLKNSESQINELQSNIKKLRDELDMKQQELDNVSEEKSKKENILLTTRQEYNEIIARKTTDMEELEQKIIHQVKDQDENRSHSEELRKKIEVLTHDLQCQKELELINSQSLQQLRSEKQELENTANVKCTELQNILKEMEADKVNVLKNSESQINELQSDIKKLRDEFDIKQQELDNVSEEKSQQENILLTTRQEYNEIIARKTADMDELETKIVSLNLSLKEEKSINDRQRLMLQEKSENIETLTTQIQKLEEKLQTLSKDTEIQQQLLCGQNTHLDKEVENLKEQVNFYQLEQDEYKQKIKELKHDLNDLNNILECREREYKSDRSVLEDKVKSEVEKSKMCTETNEKELDKFRQLLAEKDQYCVELENNLKSTKDRLITVSNEKTDLFSRLEAQNVNVESLTQQQNMIGKLSEELKHKDNIIQKSNNELELLKNNHNTELKNVIEDREKIETELTAKDAQIKALVENIARFRNNVKELTQSNNKLELNVQQKLQQIDQLETQMNEAKELLLKSNYETDEKIKTYEGTLLENRSTIDTLQEKLSEIDESAKTTAETLSKEKQELHKNCEQLKLLLEKEKMNQKQLQEKLKKSEDIFDNRVLEVENFWKERAASMVSEFKQNELKTRLQKEVDKMKEKATKELSRLKAIGDKLSQKNSILENELKDKSEELELWKAKYEELLKHSSHDQNASKMEVSHIFDDSLDFDSEFKKPLPEDSFDKTSRTDFNSTFSSTESARSIPRGTGNLFFCEDEPSVDMEWGRLSELQRRNTLCLPHMKSSYPVETQMVEGNEFNDDAFQKARLSDGNLLNLEQKSRKRKTNSVSDDDTLDDNNSTLKQLRLSSASSKRQPSTPKQKALRVIPEDVSSKKKVKSMSEKKRYLFRRTPKRQEIENRTPPSKKQPVSFSIGITPKKGKNLTRQRAFIQKQPVRTVGVNLAGIINRLKEKCDENLNTFELSPSAKQTISASEKSAPNNTRSSILGSSPVLFTNDQNSSARQKISSSEKSAPNNTRSGILGSSPVLCSNDRNSSAKQKISASKKSAPNNTRSGILGSSVLCTNDHNSSAKQKNSASEKSAPNNTRSGISGSSPVLCTNNHNSSAKQKNSASEKSAPNNTRSGILGSSPVLCTNNHNSSAKQKISASEKSAPNNTRPGISSSSPVLCTNNHNSSAKQKISASEKYAPNNTRSGILGSSPVLCTNNHNSSAKQKISASEKSAPNNTRSGILGSSVLCTNDHNSSARQKNSASEKSAPNNTRSGISGSSPVSCTNDHNSVHSSNKLSFDEQVCPHAATFGASKSISSNMQAKVNNTELNLHRKSHLETRIKKQHVLFNSKQIRDRELKSLNFETNKMPTKIDMPVGESVRITNEEKISNDSTSLKISKSLKYQSKDSVTDYMNENGQDECEIQGVREKLEINADRPIHIQEIVKSLEKNKTTVNINNTSHSINSVSTQNKSKHPDYTKNDFSQAKIGSSRRKLVFTPEVNIEKSLSLKMQEKKANGIRPLNITPETNECKLKKSIPSSSVSQKGSSSKVKSLIQKFNKSEKKEYNVTELSRSNMVSSSTGKQLGEVKRTILKERAFSSAKVLENNSKEQISIVMSKRMEVVNGKIKDVPGLTPKKLFDSNNFSASKQNLSSDLKDNSKFSHKVLTPLTPQTPKTTPRMIGKYLGMRSNKVTPKPEFNLNQL